MIWRFAGREMTFERVRVMGILNVTPDSFSDGGRYLSLNAAVERALEMEQAGADILDIGGESTRPGAKAVSVEEELERILPVIRTVRSKSRIPISVDTTKRDVARAALEAGAQIINDVDGLGAAREMAGLVQEFGAGLILMHRRGDSETMQQLAHYDDVVDEVFRELDKTFRQVLAAGVQPDHVALDPGIGFAKNPEQSMELITGLKHFQSWIRPVLIGPSRKSFIGSVIKKAAGERDWGTAAAVALAVANGAHLVRVHNVEMMKDVVRVAEALVNVGKPSHVRT